MSPIAGIVSEKISAVFSGIDMNELIHNFSRVLAEAFWRFLRPRRSVTYEFRQDGALIRVKIEVVVEEFIELKEDIYEAVA